MLWLCAAVGTKVGRAASFILEPVQQSVCVGRLQSLRHKVRAGCAGDPATRPTSDSACVVAAEAAGEAGETPQETLLEAARKQKARIAWKDLTSTLGAAEGRQRIRAQQQQAAQKQLQTAVEVRHTCQCGDSSLADLIWGPS